MSAGALVPSPVSTGASCSSEMNSTPKLEACCRRPVANLATPVVWFDDNRVLAIVPLPGERHVVRQRIVRGDILNRRDDGFALGAVVPGLVPQCQQRC